MINEAEEPHKQRKGGYKSLIRVICPNTLPPKIRSTTLCSLRQLLNEMPDEFWERYESLEYRAYHPRYKIDSKLVKEHQKIAAYEYLKQQQIVTECAFAAAINTSATNSLSDHASLKYSRFQILVIVSCLQLYLIGGHESAIENALREIRLVATDIKHLPLLDYLPDINLDHDLEQLINSLRTSRDLPIAPLIERGIGFLFVAIYDAYRFAKGITRYRKSTKLPTEGARIELSPFEKLDDTSIEAEELTLHADSPDDVQPDETPIVEKHKTLRIYDPKSPHKSLYLQAELNKRFTEQLAMRQLSLPCSFENASDWDIEHLVRNVVNEPTEQGLWLLLGLICGGIPIKGSKHRYLKDVKGWPCLVIEHKVPAGALDEKLHDLLPRPRARVVLPLPAIFKSLSITAQPKSEEALREHIRCINDRHQTRLTLGRITRYLEHWFVNQGIDTMLVALIRGYNYKKRPALAYCNIPAREVIASYQQFIEYLFNLVRLPSGMPASLNISTKIGSSLLLPDNVLHNLFNLLLIPPLVPRHDASLESVIDFHNQYLGYVWALLSFVVGHRDVTAPLGKLSDFNFTNHTWWISDKENRIGLTARTLVIPEIAVNQLNLYLSHIKALGQRTRLLHDNIADRCNGVLDGSQNLLFFIYQDQHGNLMPQDLTPKNLKQQLGKRMPLPQNWARHHLRSILHHSGLSASVINGWMGHENIGEEIFGHHSGLSIQALRGVANVIEKHLTHHQIEARSGWQTR